MTGSSATESSSLPFRQQLALVVRRADHTRPTELRHLAVTLVHPPGVGSP
jgi:hypothetical protein